MARLYIAGFGSGWSDGLQQAGPLMVALIAIGMAGQFTPAALFERAATALGRVPSWGLGATAGIQATALSATAASQPSRSRPNRVAPRMPISCYRVYRRFTKYSRPGPL